MHSSEDTFLKVFQDLKFPFLSIDTKNLADIIEMKKGEIPNSYIDIALNVPTDKKKYLINSLRGIIHQIEPGQEILTVLSMSPHFRDKVSSSGELKGLIEAIHPAFAVASNEKLRWEEATYWPVAYNMIFGQFINVVLFFNEALILRVDELNKSGVKPDVFSEYPRMAPTAFHFAAASLGAWIGGASNMQYFCHYATSPQIRENAINEKYLLQIGYDAVSAKELSNSGIIGVPASLLAPLMQAQASQYFIFGSLQIDEWNVVNFPRLTEVGRSMTDIHEEDRLSGIVIDKHYRTPFFARKIANQGLLGTRNVLRDHYDSFYKKLGVKQLIRCKHFCAPIIDVGSIREMESLIKEIPIYDQNEIFFRGQTAMYTVERHENVKKLLFAESCSKEPSLPTAASRLRFDYDKLHFALKYFINESIEFNPIYKWPNSYEIWKEKEKSPLLELDHALTALAQHYGIPSHGLDITTSLDVATWFATNKYHYDDSSFAWYNKLTSSDWDIDPEKWPVIFVCQAVTDTIKASMHTCEELVDLGITALRPERQHAKFFLGGHNEHQNRLAEMVVCVFRLKPENYATVVDFDFLFPTPSQDKAYSLMLDFAKAGAFQNIGANKVNRFH
ncbi:FRG domain-containing protein [Pedobacter sp. P351]|uniref:FRG domain-containing protein n=1 Tax=Pedobacter superstes TaxID=3133441 RepID=UPI0030A586F3